MRILVIGGTGFIGHFLVPHLVEHGHAVTVYHRGHAEPALAASVGHILDDRNDLGSHLPEFQRLSPDVVIDMILSSERQARTLMETFRGIAGRVVALSSQDVYRACGILHGLEPGPLQALPLTEDSELRTRLKTYGPETIRTLQKIFPWLDDEYDKIPVERAVLGDLRLAGTVVRLPMVFGPGDPLHRFFPTIKRIDDGRTAILLQEDAARWRAPRGYVENVAAAIALAGTSSKSADRIYNLGEPEAFSELEWAQKIGRAAGWQGSVLAVPTDRTPAHLRVPFRNEQHWVVSTARVRRELGFAEPVALDAAIERTIAWERANPPAEIDPKQFDYAAEDSVLADLKRMPAGAT